MKVTITCNCSADSEFVYDLLTTSSLGNGVLTGVKPILDEHLLIPDIMEFDLSFDEIKELEKLPQVKSVQYIFGQNSLAYTKTSQQGIPRMASNTVSFTNNQNVSSAVPHHLYYCANYDPIYTTNSLVTDQVQTLNSIDCSNVDIIVLDSGVDITHKDFLDQNGNSRVVNFNWTVLKEGHPQTGAQIVNFQSSNYYTDTNGHGTSCASLIAGNRCGFAKNAKIYALHSSELGNDTNGFDITTCLKLAVAFQIAKKQNLFGLNSNRPTIFSNSWGSIIYANPLLQDNATDIFSSSVALGKNNNAIAGFVSWFPKINAKNSTTDAYFRQLLNLGVHCLVAAGNNNQFLKNDPNYGFDCNVFFINVPGTFVSSTITVKSSTQYLENNFYGLFNVSRYIVADYYQNFYGSPNIGLGYSKTDYPIIIVGDTIPIGNNDSNSTIYDTGGNSRAAYNTISNITSENRIVIDEKVRYDNLIGPFFVKSSYSNFGPDVDIYATGNASWAALSNNIASVGAPNFTLNDGTKFRFFNGTSAATPIVAGCLATYLAEYPNKTPLEAKNWLLTNAISGNIFTTVKNTRSLSAYNGVNFYNFDIPYGANYNNATMNGLLTVINGGTTVPAYNSANIDDILFFFRFFDSNNLMAQAYPLRKAVLNAYPSSSYAVIADSSLEKGAIVNKKPTNATYNLF